MFKTATIVVVGSEFFSRDKKDTNSIWLTEELEKRGVRVLSKSIVADDLETLTQVVRQGMEISDLVLSTGGLGPTEDDRTREAAARACGVELEFHESIEQELARRFAKRGREMAANNRRQAYLPQGSEELPNASGTAPGFICNCEAATFAAFPGPPRELKAMFATFLEKLSHRFGKDSKVKLRRTLRVSGLGESDMDRRIADLYKDLANPEVTINFTPNDLELHLTATADSTEEANSLIAPLVAGFQERLEGHMFSVNDESLAEVVVALLKRKGLRVSLAESVSGGLLASEICSVPGASEVLECSLVTYTDSAKKKQLGVSAETLAAHGAVSEAVARAMAENLRNKTGTDFALSCTGFAGPGGGTESDPVGTVYIGLSSESKTSVRRISLPGGRNLVRSRVVQAMLFRLFRILS